VLNIARNDVEQVVPEEWLTAGQVDIVESFTQVPGESYDLVKRQFIRTVYWGTEINEAVFTPGIASSRHEVHNAEWFVTLYESIMEQCCNVGTHEGICNSD